MCSRFGAPTLIRRVPHDRVDDLELVDRLLQANLSRTTAPSNRPPRGKARCQAAVHLLDVNTVRATFYEERENRPVAPNALELQRTSKKGRVVAEVVRKEPILAVSVQVPAWCWSSSLRINSQQRCIMHVAGDIVQLEKCLLWCAPFDISNEEPSMGVQDLKMAATYATTYATGHCHLQSSRHAATH